MIAAAETAVAATPIGSALVDCAVYVAGRRERSIGVDEIPAALKQGGALVWLGLVEPDEPTMRTVQEKFGLHDLAVEDAHRAHQRPKLEAYGDSLFLVLKTAGHGPEGLAFGETHVFVGPNYVVTIRHGPSQSYAPLRARCEAMQDKLALGPGFVLYALMDYVVDSYFPLVQELEDDLERLEERLFRSAYRRSTSERIYRLRRSVTQLRRAAVPAADLAATLYRQGGALIPEATRPYFRDVYDHAVRINDALEALREMLTTALHVNISLLTVGQNEVVKKLAGWAAILAIPTLVASIYGMNFEVMPELHWRFGYPLVTAATAAACLLLYRRLKRAGWI